MTKPQLDVLVHKIDDALEECYVAQANHDPNRPEDIYYLADEALDQGIGAVLVHTASGSLRWFCLQELVF